MKKAAERDSNGGSATPETTLISTLAHIVLSPQFHHGHQSRRLSVLEWRTNRVFSSLRISIDGESPNSDFLWWGVLEGCLADTDCKTGFQ